MKRPHRADELTTGDLMDQQLGTPALDPAFVIGWHVGKALGGRVLVVAAASLREGVAA